MLLKRLYMAIRGCHDRRDAEMTECRYCTHSNGTWNRRLREKMYSCILGEDTKAEHCDFFKKDAVAIAIDPGNNERTVIAIYSDDEIEEIKNIYEGSIQDTFNQ